MAAGALQGLIRMLARVPLIGAPVRRRAWYPWRHHWVLLRAKRENVRFTQFVRLPSQHRALVGPVLDFLRPDGTGTPLRILIFGCSNGAEPYSIASMLMSQRPDVAFHIEASDIDPVMIEKAQSARYPADEVTKNPFVNAAFVASTFVADGDSMVVRPEIRERIAFRVADVLDPGLVSTVGKADIVVAQNFLYHLARRDARKAFANLCSVLKPRAALFVDGMDVDIRQAMTRQASLRPLDDLLVEIHADALVLRGSHWPWIYWSLEPMSTTRKDWKRRYATIFLRDESAAPGSR